MDLGSPFGGQFGDTCVFVVEKVSARKQTDKKVPPKVKQPTMVVAQGSQTARPKVKD